MMDNFSNEGELRNRATDDMLAVALAYLDRGFSVVPQRAGDKKPCVRWKPFQERLPTREEVTDWLTCQFPDAGLAVVLGPVSNLFVIDVDGPEAHAALIARLGAEPVAPKVISGSGKPSRFHLFFRHPAVATRAKITPWHPKLEFRGNKGIVVLPPSRHKSGLRYQWAPGQSLDDVALPEVPAAVLAALSERAAEDAGQHQQPAKPVLSSPELNQVQKRARAYIAKLPAAIEGQGGDKQTFAAACHMVIGFGLSPADALPLLREYNQRCMPPWTEAELVRKLQEADKRPGPRGTLVHSSGQSEPGLQVREEAGAPGQSQPVGQVFAATVPDFVLADWLKAMPRWVSTDSQGRLKLGRPFIGGGFHWAIHLAVLAQRSARVILPDVLLGQVFWAGERKSWPANWRQGLLDRLQFWTSVQELPFVEVTLAKKSDDMVCPDCCSLHGSAVGHRHFMILIRTEKDIVDADRLDDEGQPTEDAWLSTVFLGVLELYGFDASDGERAYDFTLQTQRASLEEDQFKALTSRLRRFRSAGRLVSVYLPLRLFGGSKHLGLSFQQRQLLLAIHRELTREKKSTRPDKASVLTAGRVARTAGGFTIDHYPGLQDGTRYVGLNGNGGPKRQQFHGRGYRILGDKGWLVRARYAGLGETADAWRQVRSFLKDMQKVGQLFGLVTAARHPKTAEWFGLADLLDRTKTAAGRKWLEGCVLRFYTEEDYLLRWRKLIADRMGFATIPDRDQEQQRVADPASSPVQLTAYLRDAGITQKDLARELGVSRPLLSQYLNGKKTWTASWQARLNAWVAGREHS